MKTTIVCGLLGAGKTTFIRHVAKGSAEKTVILVNDFGKAGIDGEIFSSGGLESIELPSGCVCCTLKFDLITTIQGIMETLSPEHLLIEPSGVASPSGVLDALNTLKIAPVTVVGIVDATEFVELHETGMYGYFFEDQIVNSDIILVNKTDLAGRERTDGTVTLVESINPRAIVLRTVNAALRDPIPLVLHAKRTIGRNLPHFRFDTLSLRLKAARKKTLYEKFFDDMAKGIYGNVVRAKALVQTDEGPFRFDLSYGSVDKSPFPREITESRLVVIGEDLGEERFDLIAGAADGLSRDHPDSLI